MQIMLRQRLTARNLRQQEWRGVFGELHTRIFADCLHHFYSPVVLILIYYKH
jgi:hypothetical protein